MTLFTRLVRKFGTASAAGVVGISLLLGATTVRAATVEMEGTVATAIRDLAIGGNKYDIEFTCNTTTFEPWGDPPVFDVTNYQDAYDVTVAAAAALTQKGGVLAVGCGSGADESSPAIFRTAFELTTISVLFIDVKGLKVHEGVTDNDGTWVAGTSNAVEFDLFPWGDDSVVPLITVSGSGGSGNQPPRAEAGGPYEGSVGEAIQFDGSDSSDLDGGIDTYTWDFGDNTTRNGSRPSHTYNSPGTYNVTLTVTDDRGLSASDSTTATVGSSSKKPIADAGGPYSGTVGAAVQFDGAGSRDPDGNISTYRWDFGDGTNKNGVKPKHTYNTSGSFDVKLTVTDNSGETDSETVKATIGQGNRPPNADPGGPYTGAAGVAKQFDGSDSTDPDGNIDTYTWNFGDGTPERNGKTPSHTYNAEGSYSVTLTVTDDFGLSDSTATTAVIGSGEPPLDDRLVDVASLPNVGGSIDPDLAVLDVGLANGDQVSATIHVRDGGTGEEIHQTTLTNNWTSIALQRVPGDMEPQLAVLQVESGDIRVQLLNADDGSVARNIAFFENEDWTPIDMIGVADAGGPGLAGIGVLAENPAGQQAIEVYRVGNGALVERVLYFNDAWNASAAIDLGDFNGNGRSEMAVLATNNAGKHAVETRDALSAKQISRYFFLGPTNVVIGLADVPDVDGNGRPENVVLGNKDANDNTANTIQAKDVKSDALISKVGTYGPEFIGFGIASIRDVDGNGFDEVVVGVVNINDNSTSVSVRDIAASSLTKKTGFLGPAYDPRDVVVLSDVSGNFTEEVVVAGVNGDTLAIRVQLRDALEGTLLRNIDIN